MALNAEELMKIVVKAAEDKKAGDVVALNLTGISLITDYFVICHGNSEVQVKAIADEVRDKAEENGVRVRGVEGMDAARWVLIDLGDVIAHIFHRDERPFYNLERLWSDAKVVELV
jgi:ribosome-associated protein